MRRTVERGLGDGVRQRGGEGLVRLPQEGAGVCVVGRGEWIPRCECGEGRWWGGRPASDQVAIRRSNPASQPPTYLHTKTRPNKIHDHPFTHSKNHRPTHRPSDGHKYHPHIATSSDVDINRSASPSNQLTNPLTHLWSLCHWTIPPFRIRIGAAQGV